jgi:hypothetical protein
MLSFGRFSILAALSCVALLCGASAARADYFVWQDVNSGVSLSYPDTWRIVNNEQPHDVVTIMAPSGRGHAACRVRVRDDMRFSIYPPSYNDDIQQIGYSRNFWDGYLREFSNPTIYNLQDKAGLGKGYASMAEAGYWDSVPGPMMQKEALLFVALYNNHVYVLECSAQAKAYAQWRKDFIGIAGSVDFVKVNHELFTGYYRNFMLDPRQRFQNPDDKTISVY